MPSRAAECVAVESSQMKELHSRRPRRRETCTVCNLREGSAVTLRPVIVGTIALILSCLQRAQASAVLGELTSVLQSEVARRLAEIGKINPEVMQEIEKVLESRLHSLLEGEFPESDGKEALLERIGFHGGTFTNVGRQSGGMVAGLLRHLD